MFDDAKFIRDFETNLKIPRRNEIFSVFSKKSRPTNRKAVAPPFETIVDPQSVIPPDGTDQRESETGGTLLAGALIEAFEDMFGIDLNIG